MRHVTTKGLNKCFFDREEARSGPTSSIVVVVGALLKDGLLRLYLTNNIINTKQLIELVINKLTFLFLARKFKNFKNLLYKKYIAFLTHRFKGEIF